MKSFMEGPQRSLNPDQAGGGLENKKNLEELAFIGYAYRSFIQDVINGSVKEKFNTGVSQEWYEKLKKVTEPMLAENKQIFEEKNLDKVKLLQQVRSLQDKSQLVEDLKDQIEFEEKVPGFFVLKINRPLFQKLHPGAAAFAYVGKEGATFIALQTLTENEVFNKKEYESNVPHELSHLVWKEIKKNNLVENREQKEDLFEAFAMYRDEVVARINGGQRAMGYASPPGVGNRHDNTLWYLQPHITEQVGGLNELLTEKIHPLLKQLKLSPDPILGMCLTSKNFSELRANFLELHTRLEKAAGKIVPQKEEPPSDISSCVIEP